MSRIQIVISLIIISFCVSISIKAGDIEWKQITADELAQKIPKVEADADAEAIFWEVRLDDKKGGRLSYNHYVRVKIFTERGREKYSKFDIPFTKNRKIEDVAARVIKPDGTIIQLNPSDIFEREILKARKFRIQAKSFAIPSIDVGVIVEYQYREVVKGDSLHNERVFLQRDIPLQSLTYYFRPYANSRMTYKFFNHEGVTFQEDADKFYRATVVNVPAFKEEPQMPPDDEVRPWILLRYNSGISSWVFFGMGIGQYFKDEIKPSKEITQKAAELTAGITSNRDKLKKIYEFTQKQIKNITYDRSYTDEQRENIKIKNVNDVLKNGYATSQYVDLLFASLAKAAGFSPNLVLSGNRNENFFDPDKYPITSFIHPCCIAINVDGTWTYFNPGTPYLPYAVLLWYEETTGMIASDGDFIWRKVPFSVPSAALAKRSGQFKLLEDGTLEGTAKIEYLGQRAIVRRQENYFDSPSKREEKIKEEIKERIKTAEITDIVIENFDDSSNPLIYSYKIRIPNYAQKTGKRLFLQPGFFEYGEKPVFTASSRTHPVYFEYAWSDQDEIEISLPANYIVETSDAPKSLADNSKITEQVIKITLSEDQTSLKYNRDFYFGGNGKLLFPSNVYPALKNLFESFQKADAHTITLRQK